MVSLPAELADKIDHLMGDDLQGWAAICFLGLIWATRLVLLGVALEGIELVHDGIRFIKRRLRKRRERAALMALREIFPISGAIPETESDNSHGHGLVKAVGRIGLIAVVVGVAGELIFEVKVEQANNSIHTFDSVRLTAAAKAAGVAQMFAQGAAANAYFANKTAEKATASSREAQALALTARKEIGHLNGELSTAKTQLEAVDAKRAELEKSLVNLAVCNAPRVIPLWSIVSAQNKKAAIDPLRPFAGHRVIIEFVPDAEARRAAFNVAEALNRAGWKIAKLDVLDGIKDGVEVQHFVAPSPTTSPTASWNSLWQAEGLSLEAASAVVDFLHSYNWQAKLGWPLDEKGAMIRDPQIFPPDTLKIRVGLYPPVTFVSPPGAKEFTTAMAQFDEERDKNRKQMENERLKRDEETLKHLSPQQAMEFKARREQSDQEEKRRLERYSSPCQPLIPLSPSLR